MNVLLYYDDKIKPDTLLQNYELVPKVEYSQFGLFELTSEKRSTLESNGAIILDTPDMDLFKWQHQSFSKDIFCEKDEADSEQTKSWIIQFIGPIKPEWLITLERFGIEFYGRLRPYSVFASFSRKISQLLREKTEINWIGRYHPKCKCIQSGNHDLIVHRFPWSEKEEEIIPSGENLSKQQILQNDESVLSIESYFVPELSNDQVRKILKSDLLHNSGQIGLNQIIAVTDTGIYSSHDSFAAPNKIVKTIDLAGDSQTSGGDGNGHGTHVAGSIAGQVDPYIDYNKYDGQSFGSRLIAVKVFDNSGSWSGGYSEYKFWNQAHTDGARINNNSWGANTNGVYNSTDRNADLIAVDQSDYTLVVAAGNYGSGSSTLNSPGNAKNVITVGACSSSEPENLANFSSRGPTHDQRIKPDLIAPGVAIASAQAQTLNSYIEYKGTSMATPQVSGCVALLRQELIDNGENNPSSSLIKALLINGAVPMSNEGAVPNFNQGWGRVDLSRSIPSAEDRELVYSQVNEAPTVGSKWTKTFNIDSNALQVKVTLVWIDPPAIAGSTEQLVNNLNLRMITPNGTTYLGNNFQAGVSVTGNSPDITNNVEGIQLNHPEVGEYQIEVVSTELSSTNLGFALVTGIDLDNSVTPRVAVFGDYQNQLQALLEKNGYQVDSFNDYSGFNSSLYDRIVVNEGLNTSGFDTLVSSGKKLILLGPYPASSSGVGIHSVRKSSPQYIENDWGRGPLTMTVAEKHPIIGNHSVGTEFTLINGGYNDYQSHSPFDHGSIGSNPMGEGRPSLISLKNQIIFLSALGTSYYTNVNNWTVDGKKIFLNSVAY
jgi:hypothetical protein